MCARISWFTRSFRLPRHASPVSTTKVETVHPPIEFSNCLALLSVENASASWEIPSLTEPGRRTHS